MREARLPARSRLRILQAVIAIVVVMLIGRLWQLQMIAGERYRLLSDRNRLRQVDVAAPRGVIYDRNGEILARNRPSFSVVIIPGDLPLDKENDPEGTAVAALLDHMLDLLARPVPDLARPPTAVPAGATPAPTPTATPAKKPGKEPTPRADHGHPGTAAVGDGAGRHRAEDRGWQAWRRLPAHHRGTLRQRGHRFPDRRRCSEPARGAARAGADSRLPHRRADLAYRRLHGPHPGRSTSSIRGPGLPPERSSGPDGAGVLLRRRTARQAGPADHRGGCPWPPGAHRGRG